MRRPVRRQNTKSSTPYRAVAHAIQEETLKIKQCLGLSCVGVVQPSPNTYAMLVENVTLCRLEIENAHMQDL